MTFKYLKYLDSLFRGIKMLNVSVTDEAKDFISKKTDTITVRMEMCGG